MLLQIAYLTLYPDLTEFKNRFSCHCIAEDQASSLAHLVNYLEITSFILLSSSNSADVSITNIIHQDLAQNIVSKISYGIDILPNVAENIIEKW